MRGWLRAARDAPKWQRPTARVDQLEVAGPELHLHATRRGAIIAVWNRNLTRPTQQYGFDHYLEILLRRPGARPTSAACSPNSTSDLVDRPDHQGRRRRDPTPVPGPAARPPDPRRPADDRDRCGVTGRLHQPCRRRGRGPPSRQRRRRDRPAGPRERRCAGGAAFERPASTLADYDTLLEVSSWQQRPGRRTLQHRSRSRSPRKPCHHRPSAPSCRSSRCCCPRRRYPPDLPRGAARRRRRRPPAPQPRTPHATSRVPPNQDPRRPPTSRPPATTGNPAIANCDPDQQAEAEDVALPARVTSTLGSNRPQVPRGHPRDHSLHTLTRPRLNDKHHPRIQQWSPAR